MLADGVAPWPEGGRLPAGLDDGLLDAPGVAQIDAAGPLDLSDATAAGAALPGPELPAESAAAAVASLRSAYAPRSLGPWAAREAVAHWLGHAGRQVAIQDLVLATSTSEAMSFLFKWAGRPNDLVCHMQPGYPLAAHLAELEGLRPVPLVTTFANGRWHLDLEGLERMLAAGARIVILTDPNNPTGACLSPAERCAVAAMCNAAGALCIVDEVFAPYHHRRVGLPCDALPGCEAVVSLGGMSKAALLPQLKVSWLALAGSAAFRRRARIALTWIADAYLSISAVTAALVPGLCELLTRRQAEVRSRLLHNKRWLGDFLRAENRGTLWPTEAGFVAPVQLRVTKQQLRAADVTLTEAALYDLPPSSTHVASLLLPEAVLAGGWQRLYTGCGRRR